MKFLIVAALVTLAPPAAAYAAMPEEDAFCGNVSSAADGAVFGLARVQGQGRLYFRSNMQTCQYELADCHSKASVGPGDVVITQRKRGDDVCVLYPKGGVGGWINADRLAPMPTPASPALKAWVGAWRNDSDTIHIAIKAGQLIAKGHAYWPSAHPPRSLAPGGPNFGRFDGLARPSGNRVVFRDGDGDDACIVTSTLWGGWMVTTDNSNCGGQNVRFNGVFKRR